MASKQQTAYSFTRKQGSWAEHIHEKVNKAIDQREAELLARGVPTEAFNDDEKLMDLYDDELFFGRYADEMAKQHTHLREKYYGEGSDD